MEVFFNNVFFARVVQRQRLCPSVSTTEMNLCCLCSLQTSLGTGLEAFFRPDGALVVGISTKKEFLSASVTDFPLLDGQWHCVDVCHMAAR